MMLFDVKNLERRFTEMAERGWMIDKIGSYTLRYRAVAPCKKHFFVDCSPQIASFDYPRNEDVNYYRTICEESGWTLVWSNPQIHIFCADADAPAPVPIHTDNKIQAKNYLRAFRKYELTDLIFGLLVLLSFSLTLRNINALLSNIRLFMTFGFCFLLAGFVWTLGSAALWCGRTIRSARNDLPIPVAGYRSSKLRDIVINAGFAAFLACIIIGAILDICAGTSRTLIRLLFPTLNMVSIVCAGTLQRDIDDKKDGYGKKNISFSAVSVALIVAFMLTPLITSTEKSPYLDSLDTRPALTLKNTGIPSAPFSSFTLTDGSVAVPVNYYHREFSAQGQVATQVIKAINNSLAHRIYSEYFKKSTMRFGALESTMAEAVVLTPDEAASWGAQEGLTRFSKTDNIAELLLLNDTSVLRLSVEGETMDMESVQQAVKSLWS